MTGADRVPGRGEEKRDLRKRILALRDALPGELRRELGTRITARLLKLDAYREAGTVLAYLSFGGEFDTAAFTRDALANRKKLALPRVNRATRELELFVVRDPEEDVAPGILGIREPLPGRCAPAALEEIGFVLMPGVAFTRDGVRLGYGGGYYDRLLARFASRPALVAAAFSLQVVDAIPVGETDQRVDAVITEDDEYYTAAAPARGGRG